jgi:hypothetical protein
MLKPQWLLGLMNLIRLIAQVISMNRVDWLMLMMVGDWLTLISREAREDDGGEWKGVNSENSVVLKDVEVQDDRGEWREVNLEDSAVLKVVEGQQDSPRK